MRSLFFSLFLLVATTAAAQERAPPEPVAAALKAANVPATAVSIVVQPLAPPGLTLAVNETRPMNPASTMKLVTTYAALNLLGPTYVWRTEALTAAPQQGDALAGDLILRGSGDPQLVIEDLWLLVQQLRGLGLRELRGDLVLDKSAFAPIAHNPAAFDGEALRPYNAGPDALLVNYKAVTFTFVPDPQAKLVRLRTLPALAGMKLPATLRAADGPCGDWREKIKADFSAPLAPRFGGAYPLACGEQHWHVSLLSHTDYVAAAFRALWEQAGGIWSGQVRDGTAPAGARVLATHESETLAETICHINKFSNNVMTRQLFLTLGRGPNGEPASLAAAQQRVTTWLADVGLAMPELVLDNGSGLSRSERIASANLAALLVHAFGSPLMPEFFSSLPLVGVDGTMRKRNGAAGFAHIKTGMLNDVRAIAGTLLAASGRRYVVVSIINHPNAPAAAAVHDELLRWIFVRG
ncbi:MAG: D-alanyl-D-alanine carboxypeptidase/D-alanyl-D-alanine-endopeptidase [Betaproteobacteria bacterium]|jgi:D-alanyl-D-alanine carboxypeptidase/D-alanyl-D-alanine-endopeptidase (penicillin-binding protein 4)